MKIESREGKDVSEQCVKYGEKGPVIIFLLGANSEPFFYKAFLEKLAPNYQVYAIEHPNMGNHTELNDNDLQSYLDYIDAVISSINLQENYYLMGFSLGGYLALEYVKQKKNILGLILLSPLTRLRSQSYTMLAIREFLNEIQNKLSRSKYMPLSIFSFVNFRFLKAKENNSNLVMNLEPLNINMSIPDIKSLVILGKKDLIIDASFSKRIFSRNPNYKVIITKNGHDAF